MIDTFFPSMLVLEDGSRYNGWSLSCFNNSIGEVVFNTGMTGYQEIITDPSYMGQMVVFTYPELGNTGINDQDNESNKIQITGIIAKNICLKPSNWRQYISLVDYLVKYKIPHIFGIDTRALSKYLRNKGVMRACLTSRLSSLEILIKQMKRSPLMMGLDLVSQITIKTPYEWKQSLDFRGSYSYLSYKINRKVDDKLNVIIIDLGVKYNILSRLSDYGCNIIVLPATSTSCHIRSYNPDGILLSNGPGDPSVVNYLIKTIKILIRLTNIPIFGICMGHQILSLALGAETFKLKFGHRGLNHPSGLNKKAEITSQNHGFSVRETSLLTDLCKITHLNLNDFTIAGIVHQYKPLFSVQYHPEASPGPHDSEYLFNHFIKIMQELKVT